MIGSWLPCNIVQIDRDDLGFRGQVPTHDIGQRFSLVQRNVAGWHGIGPKLVAQRKAVLLPHLYDLILDRAFLEHQAEAVTQVASMTTRRIGWQAFNERKNGV